MGGGLGKGGAREEAANDDVAVLLLEHFGEECLDSVVVCLDVDVVSSVASVNPSENAKRVEVKHRSTSRCVESRIETFRMTPALFTSTVLFSTSQGTFQGRRRTHGCPTSA